MNLQEFLSHPEIQLPLSWNDTYDFQGFVREQMERFRELISELDSESIGSKIAASRHAIDECCDCIIDSIENSFNGRVYEAFQQLNKAVQQVQNEIREQKTLWQIDKRLLYRVRQTLLPRLRREDIFHIPFENRHEVPPHRYSIPGLPCLYLSGSLYTCWEEMGRPPFHELQIAAFWLKKHVTVLQLNTMPAQLRPWIKDDEVVVQNGTDITLVKEWICRSIILWPLMAASSIIVKHRHSPFKPEYLIPQMLMQWVRKSSSVDGICYASTNVRVNTPQYPLAIWNYVFPAKEIKPTGRCKHLCSLFKMTEPYGWQLLQAAQVGDLVSDVAAAWFRLEFIEGFEEQYAESEFGTIEAKLRKLADMVRTKNTGGEPDIGDVNT